jgi:hypothetical protein
MGPVDAEDAQTPISDEVYYIPGIAGVRFHDDLSVVVVFR